MALRASVFSCGLLLFSGSAYADLAFTGTGANGVSHNTEAAQATFSLTGSTLTVTLTNTATAADITSKFVPTDILTAVFFGTSNIALTPVSAALTAGSSEVKSDGTAYTGKQPLGGEWAYAHGISGGLANPAGGANLVNGISSTGLGWFGNGNFGCTTGKKGTCDHTDGMAWGIVPNPFPPSTGINGGVSGHPPYEMNSVTFTLTAGAGFDLSSIDSVVFLYGTSTDGEFTMAGDSPLPEPSLIGLLAFGIGGLAWARIRRRRQSTLA